VGHYKSDRYVNMKGKVGPVRATRVRADKGSSAPPFYVVKE
jgi:hypothetical protein